MEKLKQQLILNVKCDTIKKICEPKFIPILEDLEHQFLLALDEVRSMQDSLVSSLFEGKDLYFDLEYRKFVKHYKASRIEINEINPDVARIVISANYLENKI